LSGLDNKKNRWTNL